MQTITLKPGCKVNLVLDILGRRDDGYHELDTLFWPLAEPTDTITISPGSPDSGLTLSCSDPALANPSNTIHKAYMAFASATGLTPDLAVHLVKAVPMGAGLGGGSADAAALLLHLAALAGPRAPSPESMNALAASVGADVPFFLLNGPAWARGIGERLEPISDDLRAMVSGLALVLVRPDIHVSSAWAYRAWDERFAGTQARDAARDMGSLTCGPSRIKSPSCFRLRVRNGFEDVVFDAHPKLREYKEKLLRLGASGAGLSGSGAGLFALFRDQEKASSAADAFRKASVQASVHIV